MQVKERTFSGSNMILRSTSNSTLCTLIFKITINDINVEIWLDETNTTFKDIV